MFDRFNPDITVEQYKDLLDLWSNEAVSLELQITNSMNNEEKKLFRQFVTAHRRMVIAETYWYEAIVRDIEPKSEPKTPFYKRYLKK